MINFLATAVQVKSLATTSEPVELPCCSPPTLALLALLEQAIWIYDLEGHGIVWANPAGLAVWNATSIDALSGRNFDPTSLGTAERLANLRHRLVRGEAVVEHWTLYPLGQPRRMRCRLTGVRLPDGTIGMLVEAQPPDPVELETTYELRAIEAVRQAPLMISLVTGTGHWLMHNPAAEALFLRLDHHNIPNVDGFLDLFADREQAAKLRQTAIAQGSSRGTLRVASDSFRMHEVMIRRLHDPVTGQLSLILSQQDVTRAYRLEQRLKEALAQERSVAELQRQFLLVTSHDFRTPLSIIDSAAQRIARLAIGDRAVGERVQTIRKAVRRMIESVDNTLASAMDTEGKPAFHPELRDLRPILQQAIDAQQALHPDRLIAADLPHLARVMIDAPMIEQVLENLLSNAIKYSAADRPIEVCAALHSREVVVRITDHGIGVPAADLPKLFTRYFRGSNTKGRKGTGVGLYSVRFFMDLHGGTVNLASREGEGTTVTLGFPLALG